MRKEEEERREGEFEGWWGLLVRRDT